jgi:hypothetical protein
VQRKRKKLWKERKKDLTEPVLLEMDGSMLSAAIHIYQQAGFKLISEEQAHRFGVGMVDQIWELEL